MTFKAISKKQLITEIAALRSEDGTNAEYDRALLETCNLFLGRNQAQVYKTAWLLGMDDAYVKRMYGVVEPDSSVPGQKPEPPTLPPATESATIWHVVMRDATVTFLDYDALKEFLAPVRIDLLGNELIVVESVVSREARDQMASWVPEWRGRTADAGTGQEG